MEQKMKDIPKTRKEAERQKGPIPLTALFLTIGLLGVFLLFFGPAFVAMFQQT